MKINVTQRKDGRYCAQVPIGKDSNGKLKRRTVYGKTATEVRSKVKQLTQSVAAGETTVQTDSKIRIKDWSAQWIDIYCRELAPNTLNSYRTHLKTHINPMLGHIRLTSLTASDCQNFVNQLSDKALSAKTIANIHGTLHKLLDTAVQNELIAKNPSDKNKLKKRVKPELHPLEESELTRFFETASGDKFEHLYQFDIFTGLRESELVAVSWTDIDFNNNILTVRHTLPLTAGSCQFRPTKNRNTRTIPLCNAALHELKIIRQEQLENRIRYADFYQNPLDLVFTHPDGSRFMQNNIYKHFKEIVRQVGRPEIRFHDLRHTYAVLNIAAGVDYKTISESLGHSSVAFTMDVYAFVSKRMQEEAAAKLDDILTTVLTTN